MTLLATLVVDNIGALCTMDGTGPHGLGVVEDAALVIDADRVAWLGPRAELQAHGGARGVRTVDAGGRCVVPGLIDCHTHALFLGDRADEFAQRARGESYQQILAAGGGIRSTMRRVRSASVDELAAATAAHLERMLDRGVTTAEVKTGYGLSVDAELASLHALVAARRHTAVDIVPTLLAAHAVPPEHDGAPGRYIDVIVDELLPVVARERLATACDVFVEQGAFGVDDGRRLLRAAQQRGLGARVHAEQLSHQGGAALAAELGAWSAGHLEHVDGADIEALARAGVVCEVLSLAQVFLRGQRAIPGRALADGGCTVAVATDFNPGTAMSTDLPLALGLSVTQSGLFAEEALRGATSAAARALRLDDRGVLAPGKRADVVVLDATSPFDLVYRWSDSRPRAVIARGLVVREERGLDRAATPSS